MPAAAEPSPRADLWPTLALHLIGVIGLGAVSGLEIYADRPLPRSAYAAILAGWALIALPLLILRFTLTKGLFWLFCSAALVLIHLVPWTPRKAFVQGLGRVRPGMSAAEARALMRPYPSGTGLVGSATLPAAHRARWPSGALRTGPTGELELDGALVFRRAERGEGARDWGVVRLEGETVTGVAFWPG